MNVAVNPTLRSELLCSAEKLNESMSRFFSVYGKAVAEIRLEVLSPLEKDQEIMGPAKNLTSFTSYLPLLLADIFGADKSKVMEEIMPVWLCLVEEIIYLDDYHDESLGSRDEEKLSADDARKKKLVESSKHPFLNSALSRAMSSVNFDDFKIFCAYLERALEGFEREISLESLPFGAKEKTKIAVDKNAGMLAIGVFMCASLDLPKNQIESFVEHLILPFQRLDDIWDIWEDYQRKNWTMILCEGHPHFARREMNSFDELTKGMLASGVLNRQFSCVDQELSDLLCEVPLEGRNSLSFEILVHYGEMVKVLKRLTAPSVGNTFLACADQLPFERSNIKNIPLFE